MRLTRNSDIPLRVGVDLRPLTEPEFRGWSRYTHELVNALHELNRIEVIGFSDRSLSHRVGCPCVHYTGRHEICREQHALPRLLRRLGIDVYLCTANRGLPFLAPCPTVLTLHDAVEWDRGLVAKATGKSRIRHIYATSVSLASAGTILTVSQASKSQIMEQLAIPTERIRVVYEAADARFSAHADPSDVSVRRRYSLCDPYILYVGGFECKKDVQTLLDAHELLISRGLPVNLVLCGMYNTLERFRIGSNGSGRNLVRFLGYVPDSDLPALYRGARCLAFPAVAEGFGLPALEAMSCGTPVVAAEAAALPEVIGNGGQLFTPGDPQSLAGRLRLLVEDDQNWSKWRSAALDRAAQFSWRETAKQTAAVLEEAAITTAAQISINRLARLPSSVRLAIR